MSQEIERVYTINLGKVLLSQSQHRSVRAINMIKEFARHHMKTSDIKIEEDVAHQIWSRGVRSPPRKIRVRMSKTADGTVLISRYEKGAEEVVAETTGSITETEKASDKSLEQKDSPLNTTVDTQTTTTEPKLTADTQEPNTTADTQTTTTTTTTEPKPTADTQEPKPTADTQEPNTTADTQTTTTEPKPTADTQEPNTTADTQTTTTEPKPTADTQEPNTTADTNKQDSSTDTQTTNKQESPKIKEEKEKTE